MYSEKSNIHGRVRVLTHSPAEVIGGVVKGVAGDPEAHVQSVCLRPMAEIGLNESRGRRTGDGNGFRVSAGCGVFGHRAGLTIRHRLPLSVTPNPAGVHWIWHPLRHLTTNIQRQIIRRRHHTFTQAGNNLSHFCVFHFTLKMEGVYSSSIDLWTSTLPRNPESPTDCSSRENLE